MSSTARSTRDDVQDTCVICLSTVTERAITAPCNHYTFDFVCLISWLQERSTCPLCKAEVKTVQYDWRSPEDFKSYDVHPSHVSGTRQANRTFLLAPYGLPRRPRGSQRAYSPPVEDPALLRRRQVYRNKLFSFHVGSNHFNSYREITPETFLNSAELQSKARTWIRRELRVFTFLQPGANNETRMSSSNPEFLLTYIVSILKMVDLKASNGHAENLLAELLGRGNSKLFLHELNAWLRSPFDKVDEWDNEVQYEEALDGCA